MAAATTRLTYEEFRAGFDAKSYEYWYGQAIPKGMPTWIHSFLQKIIMSLLDGAGFITGSDVELRIDLNARPKPDVLAIRNVPTGPYQTEAPEVVVEILSEEDTYRRLRDKFRKDQEWGCGQIYLVDPFERTVTEWQNGALVLVPHLASVSVGLLWKALDKQTKPNE